MPQLLPSSIGHDVRCHLESETRKDVARIRLSGELA
jgi:hypothetical protein